MTVPISFSFCSGKCPNCHEPSPMENGQVTAPNRSLNAIIRYRCDEKYILIGNSRRTCLQDGVWSGHEPVCWSKFESHVHVLTCIGRR